MINIDKMKKYKLDGVVIPQAFEPPEWVSTTFNKFVDVIKSSYKGSMDSAVVRKAIKELLLDNKISPPYPLNKKNINILLEKMHKVFDDEEFQWRYMLIYRAGFFLSTFTASSFTPESLELPKQFRPKRQKIIKEYHQKRNDAKTENQHDDAIIWIDKKFAQLASEVLQYFRENDDKYPIVHSIDSGSKGSDNDLRKLLVAIGLSINAKGEINDVIERSGAEGLTPTQFFNYTSQAIVSQYQKSRDTAIPGYLIRQLNTIAAPVKLSKTIDCKTSGTLRLKILNKEMLYALEGKILKSGDKITRDDADLIGKTVHIRSPLYCKAKDGICHTCYCPDFIDRLNLHANAGIGLLASTSQAGMLTDMTLKAAHSGLSLNKAEVDLSQDIFEFSD
jgi:DNA-directed RNA polymerase subunit beta'